MRGIDEVEGSRTCEIGASYTGETKRCCGGVERCDQRGTEAEDGAAASAVIRSWIDDQIKWSQGGRHHTMDQGEDAFTEVREGKHFRGVSALKRRNEALIEIFHDVKVQVGI